MEKQTIPELLEVHRKGKIPEAALHRLLIEWIPEKSIDEILSFLDEGLRKRFIANLVAISKPDWVSLDGERASKELVTAIRAYL